jgi:hypothetical protein
MSEARVALLLLRRPTGRSRARAIWASRPIASARVGLGLGCALIHASIAGNSAGATRTAIISAPTPGGLRLFFLRTSDSDFAMTTDNRMNPG